MEKQERLFAYAFVYTLGILLFFLGSSITGNVVQTSYCDGLDCYDYCKTNSDCSLNEVCCQEQKFGICKADCKKEFVFEPEMDVQYPFPELEQPLRPDNTLLYVFLLILTAIIGGLYFLAGKKVHIKYK